jgi:hypothetical protein
VTVVAPAFSVTDFSVPVCERPAFPGPCLALFPRYYFDGKKGQCKTFTYGGCKSNGNNFETEEECRRTCAKEK